MRSSLVPIIAYVSALFLSLPVTPFLVDSLKAAGILGAVVGAIFLASFVFGAYVLVARLRIRAPQFHLILLALLAVLGAVVATVKTHQEQIHFLEYGALPLLIGRHLRTRLSSRRLLLLTFASAAAIGLVDECIQYLLPMRYFDLRDIAFNVVASAFGTTVFALILRFAPDFHTD